MLASGRAPGPTDRRASTEDDVLSHLHDAVRDQTAADPAMTAVPIAPTGKALLEEVLASLDDDKAEEIVTIDLKGKSEMADFMVICSGRSSRQVAAISEKLVDRLKQNTGVLAKVEGKDTGDWVLIDAGDVIVHVFRPEVREFYQLEKMWLPSGARTGQTARA
jgi:ribosome-associated protein